MHGQQGPLITAEAFRNIAVRVTHCWCELSGVHAYVVLWWTGSVKFGSTVIHGTGTLWVL